MSKRFAAEAMFSVSIKCCLLPSQQTWCMRVCMREVSAVSGAVSRCTKPFYMFECSVHPSVTIEHYTPHPFTKVLICTMQDTEEKCRTENSPDCGVDVAALEGCLVVLNKIKSEFVAKRSTTEQ